MGTGENAKTCEGCKFRAVSNRYGFFKCRLNGNVYRNTNNKACFMYQAKDKDKVSHETDS